MTAQAILDRTAFRSALALAVKVTDKRNTLPILTHVALRSSGGSAVLEATDLDLMAKVTVPALADDDFAVTLPAHLLRDIEKKAPDSEGAEFSLSIADTGQERAALHLGRVKFDLPGLSVADWPELAVTGEVKADLTVSAAAMVEALEFCQGAISTEETRYYLNGIYVHATGAGELRFVATDGHRMRVRDIPAVMFDGDPARLVPDGNSQSIIIPRKTVAFLLDVLKRKGAPDDMRVIVNTTKARFVSGNVDVVSKLIDGTFPDYHRVIPTRGDKRAVIDREEFAECIKAVTCISSERGRAVRLNFDPKEDGTAVLRFTVHNPDAGSSSAEMSVAYAGDALEIGFNSTYALAECDNCTSKSFAMTMNECGAPALIHAGSDKGAAFSVLMPMRV